MTGDGDVIGEGTRIFEHDPVEGRWTVLKTVEDVLGLMESGGADGTVGVVSDAGATFLAPILHEITAIVCTAGSPRSHVAIVSREFHVPCLMGTDVTFDPEPDSLVEVDCTAEPGVVRLAGDGIS